MVLRTSSTIRAILGIIFGAVIVLTCTALMPTQAYADITINGCTIRSTGAPSGTNCNFDTYRQAITDACLQNVQQCTPEQRWAISSIAGECAGQGQINPQYCRDITQQTVRAQEQARAANQCSLWYGTWTFNQCFFAPLLNGLGSLFLSFGAAMLRIVGFVFDIFVRFIIVAYGETITQTVPIMGAIQIAWGVLRDFSNVLLIGFFVYIAISIILGINNYNNKALIANVLVVAVLMNFSLLFAKLVIDGSNFVAYRVYAQIANVGSAQTANFSISEQFLRPMGLSGMWDTYSLVERTAGTDGVQGLFFGIIGGAMLVLVAAVLLYGCFLIAARGVVFIILMIAAPYAFVSYLIPTLAKGEYGWEGWWKQLVNNAAFGPLLMILLAISLAIVRTATPTGQNSIGDIIANPSTVAQGWTTILVYVIGTGLLFVSLKLASNIAGSAGGAFNFASGMTKLLSLTPIGAGAAAIGRSMRNTLGRDAAIRGLEYDDKIGAQRRAIRRMSATLPENDPKLRAAREKLLGLEKAKQQADARARREYNFENTTLGKFLKERGMPSLQGDTKGGYLEPRKKAAEEAGKSAANLVPSRADAKADATEQLAEEQRETRKVLQEQREAATQMIQAAQENAEAMKRSQNLYQERDQAQQRLQEIESSVRQRKVEIDNENPNRDMEERRRLMAAEDERIKTAKERVVRIDERMKQIDDLHLKAPAVQTHVDIRDRADQQLAELEREFAKQVEDRTDRILSSSLTQAQELAADKTRRDRYTSAVARSEAKKAVGSKRLRDIVKAQQELAVEQGESPPATGSSTQPKN